ncbi:MAG: hypothetical protein J1F67_05125 [Muribaculaceae bacterium]|nr:hypothetical protein [Muribaculaceae bacterium]
MDEMEVYEINALIENRHLRHRESWEQSRMLAFVIARCAGSKVQNVKEVFSLPWDNEVTREQREADYGEMDRLKAKAAALIASGMMV